jgi:hypothetical protein
MRTRGEVQQRRGKHHASSGRDGEDVRAKPAHHYSALASTNDVPQIT